LADLFSKKIRPLYDEYGAEGYYRDHAQAYANPHEPEIRHLLTQHFERLDCSGGVLDFAAGGGEVARALQDLGVRRIVGCDPYTFDLFEQKTALPCLRHGFREVIRGADLGGPYSLTICSFAMHLCPEKDLYPLVRALLDVAPTLVIVTPHKRPELEKLVGVSLAWQAEALTERGKKVRIKAYEAII
jgi:SAM-dependent methyltransferase